MRRVPQTCFVPAIVSNVLSPRYLNNLLVKIPRSAWEKRKLAEMIQVSRQMLNHKPIDLTPRVTFGEPACDAALCDAAGRYLPAIRSQALRTLAAHQGQTKTD